MKIINSISQGLNYVLGFLVLLAAGYIAFLYMNPQIEKVYIQAKPTIKIVYVERPDSTTVAKSTIPTGDLAEEMIGLEKTKEMYERLIPEIKDYKKQVALLTEIRSNLEGQLGEKDIVINNLQGGPKPAPNSPTTWKTEYITITHTPENKTIDYKYKNIMQLALVRDKDSVKVSASSPDKNNKINGMDTYVQTFRIPKRFSELVFDASLGKMNFNKDFTGLWGEGKVKWMFNPDGTFRPYIYAGAVTDFNQVSYPIGVGGEIKIK